MNFLIIFYFTENEKSDSVFKKNAPEADPKDVKLAWSNKNKDDNSNAESTEPLVITKGNETTFCVVGRSENTQQNSEIKNKEDIFDNRTASSLTSNQSLSAEHRTGLVKTSSSINVPAAEAGKTRRVQSVPQLYSNEPCSPGEFRGAGLLSCFPSFKTGSNKGKAYKLVMRSPATGGSLRDYTPSKELTRLLNIVQIYAA